jgi:hypothetical protein
MKFELVNFGKIGEVPNSQPFVKTVNSLGIQKGKNGMHD